MKINKDKRIGKVLFIVEGSKTEFYLLIKIFFKICGYEMITKKRPVNGIEQEIKIVKSENSSDSVVYVINTLESNIKHINDRAYIEEVYEQLKHGYGLDIDNTAIYYIFDRDIKNNTDSDFLLSLMNRFSNARDMDIDEQGLLLLSYPCIEAFTLSNFDSKFYNQEFEKGNGENQLKAHLNSKSFLPDKISEETLLVATQGLLDYFDLFDIYFNLSDLDNFSQKNIDIFNQQENHYSLYKKYRCLSLFILALIDLGLMEI